MVKGQYKIVITSMILLYSFNLHAGIFSWFAKETIEHSDDIVKVTTRRITNLEKFLITSKNARKIRFNGRTVVQRDIFSCNQNNISLMLRGNAPFGFDNQRVNLHHLKQQKEGSLVELTSTEHNEHSKVLHRYVRKGSDITDRNNGFANFRKSYWKSRAAGCISKR